MTLVALYVAAYFLGSIPFAVILGKIKGVDVLNLNSGNPGTTNVWRILGPTFGMICFFLDVLKSLIPTLAARFLFPNAVGVFDAQFIWFTVGTMAVIGHSLSPFLKFKGGKGVSCALGVILGTSPLVGLSCLLTFLLVMAVFRYVSLASVIGLTAVIPYNLLFPNQSRQLIPIFVLLSIFVIYRHRKNFKRIREGSEPKIKRLSRVSA